MKKDLRIVFLGTPDFAVACLKEIVESERNVVGVITSPDRQAGRGRKVQQSAVKQYAVENELLVLQPTNLKNQEFQETLKALKADIQVVVAFRMLPESVWNMPPMGTFNLHASLLPKYRGAAPINWAIINGEKESGVSTFFLKHEIDTGDLLFQEVTPISLKETAGSLHDKLMVQGAALVVKTLKAIEEDQISAVPQKMTDELPLAPKIFRNDCAINWEKKADEIDQLIRGLSPYPAAWTGIKNTNTQKRLNLKVYECEILERNTLASGELKVIDNQICVGSATHDISLINLQVEGKKRMAASDLLNGFPFHEYKIETQ